MAKNEGFLKITEKEWKESVPPPPTWLPGWFAGNFWHLPKAIPEYLYNKIPQTIHNKDNERQGSLSNFGFGFPSFSNFGFGFRVLVILVLVSEF